MCREFYSIIFFLKSQNRVPVRFGNIKRYIYFFFFVCFSTPRQYITTAAICRIPINLHSLVRILRVSYPDRISIIALIIFKLHTSYSLGPFNFSITFSTVRSIGSFIPFFQNIFSIKNHLRSRMISITIPVYTRTCCQMTLRPVLL